MQVGPNTAALDMANTSWFVIDTQATHNHAYTSQLRVLKMIGITRQYKHSDESNRSRRCFRLPVTAAPRAISMQAFDVSGYDRGPVMTLYAKPAAKCATLNS